MTDGENAQTNAENAPQLDNGSQKKEPKALPNDIANIAKAVATGLYVVFAGLAVYTLIYACESSNKEDARREKEDARQESVKKEIARKEAVALNTENPSHVRVAALNSIPFEIDNEEMACILEELAVDQDSKVRREALDKVSTIFMEPQRALRILLNALNDPVGDIINTVAIRIEIITERGDLPSSKEQMQQNIDALAQTIDRLRASKKFLPPNDYCLWRLNKIMKAWAKMIEAPQSANTTSSLMRPPKAMRVSPPVLPYVDKPVKLARGQMPRSRC